MRAALDNASLQACAGANLRIAGDSDELLKALDNSDPAARAVAARELGTMQKAGISCASAESSGRPRSAGVEQCG